MQNRERKCVADLSFVEMTVAASFVIYNQNLPAGKGRKTPAQRTITRVNGTTRKILFFIDAAVAGWFKIVSNLRYKENTCQRLHSIARRVNGS
jgi:hypothetical protein